MRLNREEEKKMAESMKFKTFILISLILPLILLLGACSPQRQEYLERVRALESGETAQVDEARIESLEKEIESLVKEVEEVTAGTAELGTFYKMLAVDFFDAGMYGPSLDYLRKALYIYPENHVLYYYAALCSARVAKTHGSEDARREGFIAAENYYLEALEIKSTYRDALYGLGILYVFELNTPERGIPYLETLASLAETRTDVRFVLARAYATLGQLDAAEKQYREIIAIDPDAEAARNARRLLAEIGGEAQ
jgi:tetratricopeptide (TPR) repeat protein